MISTLTNYGPRKTRAGTRAEPMKDLGQLGLVREACLNSPKDTQPSRACILVRNLRVRPYDAQCRAGKWASCIRSITSRRLASPDRMEKCEARTL